MLATIDASIMLIAMPDVFRGIHLDPLAPGNSFYLLWMILGFLVVSSVLVVSVGRLGYLYGRVRMYNVGFVIYTLASLLLTIDWLSGDAGADWLIGFRIMQGVGAAFLIGNSAAILTDAFPSHQRGLALGINNVVGISGQFIGLVLGGILGPIDWRLIFLVSVPLGLIGTVWSYHSLRELGVRSREPIDWAGNVTFAGGLILVMVGITYGIQPYGGHTMGWTSPVVLGAVGVGVALLALFAVIEQRVAHPMFRLPLFRIRAYSFGVFSSFLSAIARGGLMFMLIIWLQGIWLPQHGYSFGSTPFWAGIHMLPLTAGILIAGPISGFLSDRYGSRPFATGGMAMSALGFALLELLPVDFSYPEFAAILLLLGLSMGAFASPNRAGVMNSLPARHRGAGGGVNQTFQNSAQVLSIGIFFTLMTIGLSAMLPHALASGLEAHGVPAATAATVSHLPPISVLFAAFLGYSPIARLVPAHLLHHLSHANTAALTSRGFFPHLIVEPFRSGLHAAFAFAIGACLLAAVASWSRGGRYIAAEATGPLQRPGEPPEPGTTPAPESRRRPASPAARMSVSAGINRPRSSRARGRRAPRGVRPRDARDGSFSLHAANVRSLGRMLSRWQPTSS
ncbi:MAG TPA: MFS transporter [Gaiellaceae bacterium]|nr:MFS transporter [Gaiellaceae bacterium]